MSSMLSSALDSAPESSMNLATSMTAAIILIALFYLQVTRGSSKTTKGKPIPRIFHDPAIRAIIKGDLGDLPALHSRYGDLVQVTFIGEPAVFVGGLSNIRTVLNSDHSTVQADLPKPMVRLLGAGNLQTIHGKDHSRDRQILSPIFTPKNIRGYIPRVAQLASDMVAEWVETSEKMGGVSGYGEVRRYVIRVGMELLMGFDAQSSDQDYARVSQLYVDLWGGFFTLPFDLPGSNYRKAIKAAAELRELVVKNLVEVMERAAMATSAEDFEELGGRTALECLVKVKDDEGNPVSKEHILTLVSSLMLGAVDTTATTLMLCLRRLARHPEVLVRAREEQDDVIAQHGGAYTDESLRSMRFIDGIIKETVRCQTPVQIVFRRAVQDLKIGDYVIPAGRKILVHVGESIVKDSRWGGASREEFQPERWLSDEGSKAGGWLPFGGGPRLCPGQQLAWTEMKLMLAAVVRGYDIELLEPDEKWKLFPLQVPVNGMPIKFTKRE